MWVERKTGLPGQWKGKTQARPGQALPKRPPLLKRTGARVWYGQEWGRKRQWQDLSPTSFLPEVSDP